ncbi:MAG TPA: transaldolase [Chloroflexi bacterium]|nr:transaldolase [Chloroflexota bacterium]
MEENPLLKLQTFGQSIWLDTIRRGMLVTGELAQLIEEDGLRGVTVNPSILEKAISGSHDYDQAVRVLALDNKKEADIYEALGVEDVQRAADLFRPMYERTEGQHGFVSLEVAPALAHDTAGTIAEARRFWAELDRPNVMIKVPATREGLPAIQQLTAEGINVNVTLLFGLPRYREVAEAYLTGLEARGAQGKPLDRVASVASFFLSRIDVLVDPKLEKVIQTGGRKGEIAASLHGQVAIASARVAYQIYQELFAGERFRGLAARGARAQRLLWASTSTKNPAYSDVKYVEALIGLDTVNTLPLETLNAYRDHGNPAPRLEEGLPAAQRVLQRLPEVGIDLNAVTQQLEDEGVHKFAVSYDRLMDTLKVKRAAALKEPLDRQVLDLNGDTAAVQERIASLEEEHLSDRLWHKDPSLWKTGPADQEVIRNALGWLHVAEKMEESLSYLSDFVADVRAAGVRHVVHMGMGGSSLAPLVFERTFEPGGNGLPLTVLDTTDPTTILEIERAVPLADTLFLVASKSGTTAEPLAFGDYFYARVKALKGDRAGENFVAITDPNTPLVKLAQERGFRQTFLNFPDIGGRYSALSYFGLVPAALLGVDVSEVLLRVLRMVHACASCVPVRENPGVVLGAVLGELVRRGRDKVTFLMPEAIATLGMWLEQLLAESTGKEGTGLLPVAGEPLGAPSAYGSDRLFVYVRLAGEVDQALERGVAALREAGQPVVTVRMDDRLDVGQEFFRWEIATATAGAILGINAFDQPNVQESKNNTNRLLTVVRAQGQLPEEQPSLVEDSVRLYAPETARSASETVAQFLAQARPGDYVALLAYLTENAATEHALEAMRLHLRDRLHLATTLGYGPRYLHSTGQFHKGGPNTGLFLLLTADDAEEAPIPGQPYTFGVLKHAQALGDLEALRKHGRRAVRVDLGSEVGTGLAALQRILATALDRG